MTELDVIVRGGSVITRREVLLADIGIADGRIAQLGPEVEGRAAELIDADGLHVFPGAVDPHVHFDEPGRTDWEGFASGTSALAAGGTTTFIDMPLNNIPLTIDGASFDAKLDAARASSLVDYALWGGLVPGNVDRLEELVDRGAAGFKAFMCDSGIDDYPAADDVTLYEGMSRCAELGSIILLHAENAAMVSALARRARAAGRIGVRDYLAARPPIAEIEAIARAILLAEETGCRIHIVHVSTARGVELVAAARERGVDVSCETCTHYLVFTADDIEEMGVVLKCAPPLRTAEAREALWVALSNGTVSMVTSDHSPAPPELKSSDDFLAAWGGISGCQHRLAMLLTEGHTERGLPLETVAEVAASGAARRFRLPGKGEIAEGADADLVLVDLSHTGTIANDELLYRHKLNPYAGRPVHCEVRRTLVRGKTVYAEGTLATTPAGRFVVPALYGEARQRRHGISGAACR
jgi:allantoinase